MIKAIPYFFLGFVAGLIFVELTNGKPALKAKNYEAEKSPNDQGIYFYYEESPQPQQDTFNNQRPNDNPQA